MSAVRNLFNDAEAALLADYPELVQSLEDVLSRYEGIPDAVDTFGVLGLHGNENPHTLALAWLLDPNERHGFGDRCLRRFLALTRHEDARSVLMRTRPVEAVPWPQLAVRAVGTPDLVVAIEGPPALLLVVEAKIDAELSMTTAGAQTTRYADHFASTGAASAAFERVFGQRPRSDPRVVLTFLHVHADQLAEPDREEQRYAHVRYADVERMLGDILREAEIADGTRSFVQQLRTSLLAGALPGGRDLAALETLRGHRSILPERPTIAVARQLRTALSAFGALDE